MCKGYLDKERNVSRYLLDVNDRLNEMKGSKEDVLEVRGSSSTVPIHTYVHMYICTNIQYICTPVPESSCSTFTTVCHHLFQNIIL